MLTNRMSILANLHAPGAKCRNHEINVGMVMLHSIRHVQVFADRVELISSYMLPKTCKNFRPRTDVDLELLHQQILPNI